MSTGVYLFRDGKSMPWFSCDYHTAEACRQMGFDVVALDDTRVGGKYLIDALRAAHDALTAAATGKANPYQCRTARKAITEFIQLMQDGVFDHEPAHPLRPTAHPAPKAQRPAPRPVDARTATGAGPARRAARSRSATG